MIPLNKKTLAKAIEKAIANGWQGLYDGLVNGNPFYSPRAVDLLGEWEWFGDDRIFYRGEYRDYMEVALERIVFSHDFAKSLWGEEPHVYGNGEDYNGDYVTFTSAQAEWQYHLQRMVIADDPIKYLGENIE